MALQALVSAGTWKMSVQPIQRTFTESALPQHSHCAPVMSSVKARDDNQRNSPKANWLGSKLSVSTSSSKPTLRVEACRLQLASG